MTKILNKKIVYSWANCEEAKQYLNQKGYFSDTYFDDTDCWQYGELSAVDPNNTMNGVFVSEDFAYGLFIPEEKINKDTEFTLCLTSDEVDRINTLITDDLIWWERYELPEVKKIKNKAKRKLQKEEIEKYIKICCAILKKIKEEK